MFYNKGFTCKNITFQACEVIYHPQCIRVGSPFRTRHYGKGTRGTQYPPSATILPFICELCTTRTHLQRELDPNCQQDALLLMLERMRMIDTAHAWDHKTVQNMCNTLKGVDQFFQNFSLPPIHRQLDLSPLKHPPLDIAIPLFWSMEHYTTAPSTRSRGFAPSWNSGRVQRSAISLYSAWWAAFCSPSTFYKDKEKRLLSNSNLGPSENILSHMTAKGMAARLGAESKPSQALNQRHILYNQHARSQTLKASNLTRLEQYEYVAAQCAELILWLGWLRSTEVFSLRIQDIELTPPSNHDKYNLPPGVGVVLLRLLPTTKTNRDKQADMVIAWETSGGLKIGHWITKLLTIMRSLSWCTSDSYLFRSRTNTHWTSYYFRSRHLYPYLHKQLQAKDPHLKHLPLTSSTTIENLFYSLHSYRQGSQSHCLCKRLGYIRAAYPYERSEHGWWRVRNQGKEDMPTHYTEATVEDRVYLTLLCF